ncbi:lactadherin-like [Ruditapes philippinarum]|uniref:lactadherin-like n=1 Tax=Ruditapes philippinarum TaxID=129788 RepID=UPI00295BD061|nr:lactadherin-like [Ruditapes philippinarum]
MAAFNNRLHFLVLSFCFLFSFIACDNGGILQIHYPNISLEADTDGNVTLQSGADASVYIVPGTNGGSVYFEGEDLLHLIKVINGLPPVWKEHSATGFFYTAFGGETMNVKLEALDPENGKMEYRVVAGTMPPGLRIDSSGSRIIGQVPDVNAIYSFTVRATNTNDKYADAVFRMEIIERNQCIPSSPCQHGGFCVDTMGETPYVCNCTEQYSGVNCEIPCKTNSLGVKNASVIPEAMMSAFLTRENYTAADGRLDSSGGSGKGWCGSNANSWLQIDLGRLARVFGAISQSYSSTYYTGSYQMTYSTDGTTFNDVLGNNGTSLVLNGTSSSSHAVSKLPDPITARFVRFHPVSYSSSHYPCLRVDLNGCYVDTDNNP